MSHVKWLITIYAATGRLIDFFHEGESRDLFQEESTEEIWWQHHIHQFYSSTGMNKVIWLLWYMCLMWIIDADHILL